MLRMTQRSSNWSFSCGRTLNAVKTCAFNDFKGKSIEYHLRSFSGLESPIDGVHAAVSNPVLAPFRMSLVVAKCEYAGAREPSERVGCVPFSPEIRSRGDILSSDKGRWTCFSAPEVDPSLLGFPA